MSWTASVRYLPPLPQSCVLRGGSCSCELQWVVPAASPQAARRTGWGRLAWTARVLRRTARRLARCRKRRRRGGREEIRTTKISTSLTRRASGCARAPLDRLCQPPAHLLMRLCSAAGASDLPDSPHPAGGPADDHRCLFQVCCTRVACPPPVPPLHPVAHARAGSINWASSRSPTSTARTRITARACKSTMPTGKG